MEIICVDNSIKILTQVVLWELNDASAINIIVRCYIHSLAILSLNGWECLVL